MPKRREIDVVLPGVSPEEAAERLKSTTKPALMPSFSSPLRGRGPETLVGRVSDGGFVVSLNDFGFKKVVPTADARFEETEDGTRVSGSIGIPHPIVWLLRLSYLASVGAVGFAGYELLTAGESALFAGLLAGFVVLATAATGWNVHHAESQIPKLEADVQNALELREPEPTETMEVDVAERDEDAEKRRASQRAREAERSGEGH